MNTISARAAAVTGARHVRMARNGQDAAATWVGDGAAAIVVCDGCSSGAYTEVGARLGAQLVVAAVAARLRGGEQPGALWGGVRAQVAAVLGQLAEAMPGDRTTVIRDHFLFTVVAAAARGDDVCVWAIGDGAYATGDQVHLLGPFADNQPPYLGYDLLDMPQPARLEAVDLPPGPRPRSVAVATDGAAELGLAGILDDATLAHGDGLRRRLAVLARTG